MPWLQVRVDADPARAAVIEETLSTLGALSVTLEDAGDTPLLEPAPGAMPLWNATRVVALFEADVEREAIADALADLGDEGELAPQFETLPDREWSRAWMDEWRPLRFGRRLWVAPLEAEIDEPGAVVLRLDPGLAFGTGTHATTALCLEWLDSLELTGQRVLDYGCGSGILAIAALRLGAAAAVGIDIDPQALEATRANASTNEVLERIETREAGDPETGNPETDTLATGNPKPAAAAFDLVVANILAGPLIQTAGDLARQHAPGGRLALAGVLTEQADDVVAAYARWYDLTVGAERDGWVRIDGTRRAA